MEAEYLSVDPYIRAFSAFLTPGSTMIGSMVGKIIESKNPKWPVGKYLVGDFGWVTHTVLNPDEKSDENQVYNKLKQKIYLLPELGDLPASLGLGMLGMPG